MFTRTPTCRPVLLAHAATYASHPPTSYCQCHWKCDSETLEQHEMVTIRSLQYFRITVHYNYMTCLPKGLSIFNPAVTDVGGYVCKVSGTEVTAVSLKVISKEPRPYQSWPLRACSLANRQSFTAWNTSI